MPSNTFDEDVVIKTVEMHTSGEPLRIIESGYPEIQGATLLDKRKYVKEHLDQYRKLLMFEPRGHFDMYGALLVTPDVDGADIAVIFMDNDVYGTMCGHGVIALGRYAVDYGFVKNPTAPETRVGIQCPCGLVEVFVEYQAGERDGEKGRTGAARFQSVPAFVFKSDLSIDVSGYGRVTVDVSYGGGFYAIVKDRDVNVNVNTSTVQAVVEAADAVSRAVRSTVQLSHPDSGDLGFLYGTIITDGEEDSDTTSQVSVFGHRQLDRSPCGSGVTARVALQHHKGHIRLGQSRKFVSGTAGELFTAKVMKELTYAKFKAIIVEVSGRAFYAGRSTFTLEKDDRLGRGFLLK